MAAKRRSTRNMKEENVVKKIKLSDDDSTKLNLPVKNSPKSSKNTVQIEHPIVQFKYDLRRVLTHSNHDLKKWINLKVVPECLQDFEFCKKLHGRHINAMQFNDEFVNTMIHLLMKDGNYLRGCSYLEHSTIIRYKILKEGLMNNLFQLILNIDSTEDTPDDKNYILDILENYCYFLLVSHPPHASYMKPYYFDMLTRPITNCKHKDYHCYDSNYGIFMYCINRLENELTERNQEGPIIPNRGIIKPPKYKFVLEMEDEISTSNYDFLDRQERISRLFLLLRIFISIFEQDLAFKMMVYNKEDFRRSHKLILSQIIWKHTASLNIGCMTAFIRKIINLFIISIRTESVLHRRTLSRLLGLIGHAIQLSSGDKKYLFSNVSAGLNSLAIEISITLQSENTSIVIEAIKFLQPCLIKYLVANCILRVILSAKNERAMNMPFNEILLKKLWQKFPTAVSECEKKNSKKKSFVNQICASDLIAIVREAVTAFIDVFDLKMINMENVINISQLFQKIDKPISQRVTRQKTQNAKNRSVEIDEDMVLTEFKSVYEQHFDFQLFDETQHDRDAKNYSNLFEKVMKAKRASKTKYLMQKFTYTPVITWITARNYYAKCQAYRDMLSLINTFQKEEKDLFRKFKV